MPHRTCTRTRAVPAHVLDHLARQVAEAHAGASHATLLRVRAGARGVDVDTCALPPGVHPAEALLGHVTPPGWSAVGVVAPAHARSLDDPAGTRTPTTVVMLVARAGHVTSHATGVAGLEAGGEPPVGRIPDLLRCSLGVPTEAPEVPAAEWWRAYWLDALVSVAADAPAEVPAPDRALTGTLPPELVQALVDEPELCSVAGWGRMRRLAAAAGPPAAPGPAAVRAALAPFAEPAAAGWMDDGCFARELLAALPSVGELLDLAAALLPGPLLAQVRQVVGPLPPAHHDGEPAPPGARGGADPPR